MLTIIETTDIIYSMISAKKAKRLTKVNNHITTVKSLDTLIRKEIKKGFNTSFFTSGKFIRNNYNNLDKLGYSITLFDLNFNPKPLFFIDAKSTYIMELNWFYDDFI